MSARADPRIDEILEVLLAMARQDFSRRMPVGPARDEIDAIAAGLNMLVEELDGAVASKRELEAAYRSLQQAQQRLVQSGKLAAIGQVAGGVAHEINNPAGWVLNALTVLARELAEVRGALAAPVGDEGALRARIGRAVEHADVALVDAAAGMERIRAVAGDLRTFMRADGDDRSAVAVAELARSAVSLARPLLQQKAIVELDVPDGVFVHGNAGRLGQVITNLLVNAAQAVPPPAERQRIRVEARADGADVVLAVEDSGPGIPPELRGQIFDPFFTTKDADQGTGLGLALAADIVHRHAGTVTATSPTALGGARFEVRLRAAPAPERPPAPSRRLRVLVIDDEPRLLRSYQLVLEPMHEVTTVGCAASALALIARQPEFDVVLCDLQMPAMDGVTFHDEVVRRAPRMAGRFIFSTGGAYQAHVKEFLARTSMPVLAKPVRPAELLQFLARFGAHEAS